MTPEEEQALKNTVFRLGQRLEDLEAELDGYRINGLADTFSGAGNQTYGGGVMRLGQNGIMLRANNTVDLPALWFVPVVRLDPANSDQYATLSGDASTANNYIKLTAKAVPTGVIRLASLMAYAEGSNAYTEHIAAHDALDATRWNGAGDIRLTVAEFSTGLSAVYIDNAPLRLGTGAADPGVNMLDGMLWYQTTIDRFRARADGITRNLTMDGTNTTLTIATGVVTATTSFHAIDTEAAAASDDLDTINGGQTGQVLYIHAANGARDVVAKDGTGNLKLSADFTLNNTEDVLTLLFDGTNWLELSRSDNGA